MRLRIGQFLMAPEVEDLPRSGYVHQSPGLPLWATLGRQGIQRQPQRGCAGTSAVQPLTIFSVTHSNQPQPPCGCRLNMSFPKGSPKRQRWALGV